MLVEVTPDDLIGEILRRRASLPLQAAMARLDEINHELELITWRHGGADLQTLAENETPDGAHALAEERNDDGEAGRPPRPSRFRALWRMIQASPAWRTETVELRRERDELTELCDALNELDQVERRLQDWARAGGSRITLPATIDLNSADLRRIVRRLDPAQAVLQSRPPRQTGRR